MSLEFKKYFILALIFDKDLKKIILRKINGKLDCFFTESNPTGRAPLVDLSKYIYDVAKYKIDPEQWRSVITLQQIDKVTSTSVVACHLESELLNDDNLEICDIENLPNNIVPSLKWIIPLCLDVSVIGSSYNQVIIR